VTTADVTGSAVPRPPISPFAAAPPLTFSGHRESVAAGRFLRVVNYHNTPSASRDALRAELARYCERFVPVSLADLDGFFATGDWADSRPGFLPVFYEGYRNSFDVAAPVCDELGISAFFFVCTGFVDCPVEEQEAFARSHWIVLVQEDLQTPGRRLAMTWDEVGELAQRHTVSPHTASHDGIADVNTPLDFDREIFEPKRKMDAVTGKSAPAFAWLSGTQWGMSDRHDQALRDAGYRYLVSNTMIHRIG
jgi:peptidoglycan/xylan/chitin deacetylase (PgdA/CDA1 family)